MVVVCLQIASSKVANNVRLTILPARDDPDFWTWSDSESEPKPSTSREIYIGYVLYL